MPRSSRRIWRRARAAHRARAARPREGAAPPAGGARRSGGVRAALRFGERLADRIASFGGSWPFIGIFLGGMTLWMAYNVERPAAFDPYPFILLNLVLSCLAALQAPIIMMSQNRMAAKDRVDARHDYEVNLEGRDGGDVAAREARRSRRRDSSTRSRASSSCSRSARAPDARPAARRAARRRRRRPLRRRDPRAAPRAGALPARRRRGTSRVDHGAASARSRWRSPSRATRCWSATTRSPSASSARRSRCRASRSRRSSASSSATTSGSRSSAGTRCATAS